MTERVVVVLGDAGRNFGAGMSGGLAFVLDRRGDFPTRSNRELVALERTKDTGEAELLKALIARHHELTGSMSAKEILADWSGALESFWTVFPESVSSARSEFVRRHLEPLKERRALDDLADPASPFGSVVSPSSEPASPPASHPDA